MTVTINEILKWGEKDKICSYKKLDRLKKIYGDKPFTAIDMLKVKGIYPFDLAYIEEHKRGFVDGDLEKIFYGLLFRLKDELPHPIFDKILEDYTSNGCDKYAGHCQNIIKLFEHQEKLHKVAEAFGYACMKLDIYVFFSLVRIYDNYYLKDKDAIEYAKTLFMEHLNCQ